MKKLFTLFTLALLTLLTTQAQDLNVWVLGNVGEQTEWSPAVGTPMVYNAELGIYELTAHFNANSYFSFTTKLGETSSDWDGITQYRFGAPANGYAIDDYLGESIQCGELGESSEQAFMVRKGADYKITLLMPDRLVMFEYMGNDDIEPDPKDEGHIYIMGAVNGNAWATNVGLQMTEKENNIFTANVSIMLGEGEELGYFGFTHALAVSDANWTAVAPFRFAAVDAESQVVVLDTPIALSEDGQSDLSFALPDGKYVVTLDMNARTMTVTADEANHMYIIGNVPFGDWNPSAGMAMDEVEEGVFQAKATVNGDVWFIFSPFNTGWDDVNANRYGPESAEEDQVIEAGETVTTQLTTSSRSYKVTGDGSEYTITFDLNNLCFKFEVDHEVINDVAYSYYIDPITHTAMVAYSDSYAGLTDVVIPATVEHDGEVYTVTGIVDGAFRGCDLRSVSLYADITEGGNGFDGCTVGTLYVAAGVTAMQGLGIDPSAIYSFGNTPAQCDGSTFASYNAALHVPVAAMTDYFLAEVWSSFNNITADAGKQPETLTLDRQEATLELGASLQLTATVAPATVVPLRWASSNPAAVTVTDDGRLTALQAGEADITVTCMGLRQQCHVTVQGQAVVATIDPQELTLERGQSATLTATTSPIDAAVTWRSTDPAVATVTVRNGQATVAAVTTGEALIIATPEGDNVVPDTCRVTVTDITVIVSLDRHALKMKRGETVYLTATTSPITADVTYSSSDTNVALVRVVGGRALVLANRPGEAMIIATAAGDAVSPDTCRVTVRRPRGDVNNDGLVDAGDVNNLINIVLGKVSDYEVSPFTELNGDGIIDVLDVNLLINVILGKVTIEDDGIREGSAQSLFVVELKALYDELDANAIHPTVATVGDYVVVCLGEGRTPVYVDKATGEKLGEIALGEAVPTGSVTSDENGNLVIANWVDGQGSNFCLWKTADVTAEPVKILEAPNAWGFTLGDYVQVIGNLDGDATIVATFGGLYAQHIARWTVTGGVVNPEAQVVQVGGESVQQIWSRDNNFNVAQRTSDPADGYFFGQFADGVDNFYYIDGTTNEVAGSLLPLGTGAEWGMKYANCYCTTFNGVNYTVLFAMGFWPNWGLPGSLYLFNTDTVDYFDGVNKVDNAPGLVGTYAVGDADFDATPYAGDGRVADVKLIPTKDGKRLDLVYTSNTHMTVGCIEFDCIEH